MRKIILLLLIFLSYSIYSNIAKVAIRNFGIITIGDNSNYIGKHLWVLSFANTDSLFSYSIKSNANDKFIYFNLPKELPIKQLNYFSKNNTEYTIKKDDNIIFNTTVKLNFLPQNLFIILRKNNPKNNQIKGKILDSYAVEDSQNFYFLVRTVLDKKLFCWYILKNNKVVNIHTEKYHPKHEKFGRITITNFNQNTPQYTFSYKNKELEKVITIGDSIKLISVFDQNKLNLPKITERFQYLEYRGYIYYKSRKNG